MHCKAVSLTDASTLVQVTITLTYLKTFVQSVVIIGLVLSASKSVLTQCYEKICK